MMKTVTALLATTAAALALAGCATTTASGAGTAHSGTPLVATLDGKAEVPGPGDADGNGEFSGWFDAAKGQICYTLGTGSLSTPTMAHIHQGDAQTAGPVVVPLQTPVQNIADTCTPASPALIGQIVANPAGYYVNVHTADFPKGAIRAQLKRK